MMDVIEKLVGLFCIIVFVTFLINHGHIDFSGVDWVKDKTTEAINSEEGQQYVKETKEISKNVFKEMFYGIKSLFVDDNDNKKETVTETNTDTEEAPDNRSDAGAIPDKKIIYTTTALSSPASNNASLTAATYLYCSSTNIIKVRINDSEESIRLIGIKVPTDDSYKEMSYDYARSLLRNCDTIYIEFDKDTSDDYGKTLAYIWLSEDTSNPENNMLNSLLLKSGYVQDAVYSPNDKYEFLFKELCSKAKENKNGLWTYSNAFESDNK